MKCFVSLLILINFTAHFNFISCNDQFCVKNDCRSNVSHKYTKEGNNNPFSQYFAKIEEAKQTYKPCDKTSCLCYVDVINQNLKPFRNGISREMIESVKAKGTKYQIIDGRLYRDKNCMFPARCSGIEHYLLKLVSNLPDMEFILNTRDWPQIHKNYGVFGPVFSFSKTQLYYDIMYPAWAFWEGGPAIGLYPKGIGNWELHKTKIATFANKTEWSEKQDVAFFRGSRTSSERDPLVLLSREQPDIVDAQYTKNQAWKSDADTLHAPPASEVSFIDHCKYKYLFNFRGVAASFRFKHILLCKSLVFHVGEEWLEFFYSALKPWVHYIPVDQGANKNNLKELILFAKNNQDVAQEIALNGFSFIWNHLKGKDVTCYWKKLLMKYSKLLKYSVELDSGLIEIV